MRGENVGRSDELKGGIKIELLFNHVQPNTFESQERRMSLVHVKHSRLNTKRRERFYSADAKHDFLAHPHLKVAAVKLGGNESVFRTVFRDISIEQVNVHASNAQFPQSG